MSNSSSFPVVKPQLISTLRNENSSPRQTKFSGVAKNFRRLSEIIRNGYGWIQALDEPKRAEGMDSYGKHSAAEIFNCFWNLAIPRVAHRPQLRNGSDTFMQFLWTEIKKTRSAGITITEAPIPHHSFAKPSSIFC